MKLMMAAGPMRYKLGIWLFSSEEPASFDCGIVFNLVAWQVAFYLTHPVQRGPST